MHFTTRFILPALLVLGAVSTAPAQVRLFANQSNNLVELNPITGAAIGTVTVTGFTGTLAGMAYDPQTNELFVTNTTSDTLWKLDYVSGAATMVGPYNLGGTDVMHGIGIDDTGQLFGYSTNLSMGTRFFLIDRTTAQATPLPGSISAGPCSLEFVASTQTMYLANGTDDSLYTIDRVTGATTLVGPFTVTGQVGTGLAYHPSFGMYATNNSTNLGLFTVNLATGAATLLAPLSGNPLALVFIETGTASTSFCTGDSVGTTCLGCGNNGAQGRGCANSSFANGAQLTASGIASVASDTLVLTANDIPGPGLFFQANGLAGGPITFGDGMLCAAVGIIRLGVVFPTAGSASYPGGSTPNPISIGGAPIVAGDIRHYQCWYRDAAPFCTADTFNLTQGLTLTWAP